MSSSSQRDRVGAIVDAVIVVRVGQAESGAVGDHDWAVEPRGDLCPLNCVADAAVDEHCWARPVAADQRVRLAPGAVRDPATLTGEAAVGERGEAEPLELFSGVLPGSAGSVRRGSGGPAASPDVGVCVAADPGSAGSIKRVFNIWSPQVVSSGFVTP